MDLKSFESLHWKSHALWHYGSQRWRHRNRNQVEHAIQNEVPGLVCHGLEWNEGAQKGEKGKSSYEFQGIFVELEFYILRIQNLPNEATFDCQETGPYNQGSSAFFI